MSIQALIFDLDVTLLHIIEDIGGAANRLLEKHGFPTHDTPDYLRWVGNGATKFIERALPESVKGEDLLACVVEFKDIYASHLHELSYVYEGVHELLNNLEEKGLPFAVLSNKPHLLTRQVVAHYFPGVNFVEVFGQRNDVAHKPDPTAAYELANLFGVEAKEELFVGDSNTDILTAQAAGMSVVAVSWGYGRLDTEGVDGDYTVVDSPAAILDHL